MADFLHCLYAFFGCLGFSFIFRIHKNIRFAVIGSLIGTFGYMIYLFCNFCNNIYIQNFIAMFIVALLSEMMARVYKSPATIFIMVGCFPLVPGNGIYYTMLYAVQGMNDLFMQYFLSTLGIGFSLAFSILISSTIIQVYRRIKNHDFASIE